MLVVMRLKFARLTYPFSVLTLKSSYAAGYAVLGLTAVTTVWAVIV